MLRRYNVILWRVRVTIAAVEKEQYSPFVFLIYMSLLEKVKFALEQAMKAQRDSRGIELLFLFKLDARCGWMTNATPRPLYLRDRDPVPIV
jgi:hypothetical protein